MKKTYVTLIIIIMLLSLLASCTNDAGIKPDTSMPQSQPTAAAVITPKPTAAATVTPMPTASAVITPAPPSPEWPEAYSPILKDYKTIASCIYQDFESFAEMNASDDYDVYGKWVEQNIPVLREVGRFYWELGYGSHDDKDAFGYALKDLNGDGSDELIILLGNEVLAIYSIVDGKLKRADIFWSRHDCYAIDKSGLLYIYSSERVVDWWYTIERLSDDGSEILPVERYGMESFDYDTHEEYQEPHYYKVTDGKSYSEREIITEAEFDELYDDWEKAVESAESALVFIPILG